MSTGSEEQLTSFTVQMEYYTQRIADTEGWTMVRLYADEGITGTSTKMENKAKLTDIVTKGRSPARTILRANILLASGRGNEKYMTVSEISKVYHTTPTTVQNVRTLYCEKGLEATINRKKRETPPIPAKVTGKVEAYAVAPAYGEPPEGYSKWTLRLLANRTVELGYIESISHVTISTILKKTNLSLI